MSRIPDIEVERLKREVDLVALVRSSGVELKPQGTDYIGRCPFHDDKTPSLIVTPSKGLWHCLGACNSGGSVIDWVMKSQRVSVRHALEILRDQSSGTAPALPVRAGSVPSSVRSALLPIDFTASDAQLLSTVQEHYALTLGTTAAAIEYLQKRGVYSPELVDHFGIGFSDRSLGLKLPQANRVKGEALRARLTELGVLRRTGHEHLVGCLTFPIQDTSGNVLSFYGRRIDDSPARNAAKHLYLSGPHRGVWNISAFQNDTLILCEAIFDALSFWNAGFKNVSATYGASGFTPEYLAALEQYGIKKLYLAFDGDEAGERGCTSVCEALQALPVAVYRVPVPKDMDINELACGVGDVPHLLSDLLAASEQISEPQRVVPVQAAAENVAAVVSPAPVTPTGAYTVTGHSHDGAQVWQYQFPAILYRVTVATSKSTPGSLRCAVLMRQGTALHADSLDLWQEKARRSIAENAAAEFGIKPDELRWQLGQILLHLDAAMSAPASVEAAAPQMTEQERAAALAYLSEPGLMQRLECDLSALGLVGEFPNQLAAYLAATSRKLDSPLAVMIQSSSAAGKSSLMDSVLSLMPEEDVVKYSAMTGQSLYYMGEGSLKHKILAIAEEAGAERASYALKLLQSEGFVSIATPVKDEKTGQIVTQNHRVEGPTAIFLTTTSSTVDEELLNRCLVLSVSETREQTRAIHAAQRRSQTLEGMQDKERRVAIATLHSNVQRLLQPVRVVNPLALGLSFGDERTRSRRDHIKYLTLIRCITFLHQHQRPRLSQTNADGTTLEWIESTPEDLALADRLFWSVMGRNGEDLPPQTLRLLGLIGQFAEGKASDFAFTRRELREHCHWGDTQLKVHLARLVDLEYLGAKKLERNLLGYSLLVSLDDIRQMTALHITMISHNPDRTDQNPDRSASGRPPVGPLQTASNPHKDSLPATSGRLVGLFPEMHNSGAQYAAS